MKHTAAALKIFLIVLVFTLAIALSFAELVQDPPAQPLPNRCNSIESTYPCMVVFEDGSAFIREEGFCLYPEYGCSD